MGSGTEYRFTSFSQAEDGIRDTSVTGVQTCALPIFTSCPGNSTSLASISPVGGGAASVVEVDVGSGGAEVGSGVDVAAGTLVEVGAAGEAAWGAGVHAARMTFANAKLPVT